MLKIPESLLVNNELDIPFKNLTINSNADQVFPETTLQQFQLL